MLVVITVLYPSLAKEYFALADIRRRGRPYHSSGGSSPFSHSGGPGSSLDPVMWVLWWTKWRWGRFSPSTSVSPANFHSTNCSKNHPHLSSGFVQ
jgi:hypothetical protein